MKNNGDSKRKKKKKKEAGVKDTGRGACADDAKTGGENAQRITGDSGLRFPPQLSVG